MCYGWFLLLRKFNPESGYSLLYLGGILSAETAEEMHEELRRSAVLILYCLGIPSALKIF